MATASACSSDGRPESKTSAENKSRPACVGATAAPFQTEASARVGDALMPPSVCPTGAEDLKDHLAAHGAHRVFSHQTPGRRPPCRAVFPSPYLPAPSRTFPSPPSPTPSPPRRRPARPPSPQQARWRPASSEVRGLVYCAAHLGAGSPRRPGIPGPLLYLVFPALPSRRTGRGRVPSREDPPRQTQPQ